ncbi:MAG: nitroreductase family protein [Rhodospirillaceae bacterium]|nr:nitroreductase family protein [Rhodospirillaceae bacterium]
MDNKALIEARFEAWAHGDRAALFDAIADDVRWTVVGTCPGGGTYESKAQFLADGSGPVHALLESPLRPEVDEVLADGEVVVVRWHGVAQTRSGGRYRNTYCWVMRLDGGVIVEVTSYFDSAAVARLFDDQAVDALDRATVDRLLSTTRAIRRRFDFDRPVPRQVLLDCLRLSQQAPTASNAQNWRWVMVTDETRRRRIAELYRSGGRPHVDRVLAGRDARGAQDRRMIDSAMFLFEHLERVPVLAIACMDGRIPEDAPENLRATRYASIYPCVWSFMLALRSRGLGSVLTTLHLNAERAIGELLDLPPSFTQMALVPIGYIKGPAPKPAHRPPVDDIVRWVT